MPCPKLRVTSWISTPMRPHEAHALGDVYRDDEERARGAELDDDFRRGPSERKAVDDALDLARFEVALTFDDFAREDDVLEVEDREVVIFEFFSSMDGYDVVQRSNKLAEELDAELRHPRILPKFRPGA